MKLAQCGAKAAMARLSKHAEGDWLGFRVPQFNFDKESDVFKEDWLAIVDAILRAI
jgi:hypothetical protein